MTLFTRSIAALAVLLLSLAPVLAANITVLVGDNFYRGPDGTSTIRMATNDVLVFQHTGTATHPTASSIWPTFVINPTTPTKTFAAGTLAAGTHAFFCTIHPGMTATLMVTAATPTATLDARAAGTGLTIYPNPGRGQVTVQLHQKAGQSYQLRLSNIIGQEIRVVPLKPELTAAGQVLDLSELRAGVYFYSLLVDGKLTSTKRLILQN